MKPFIPFLVMLLLGASVDGDEKKTESFKGLESHSVKVIQVQDLDRVHIKPYLPKSGDQTSVVSLSNVLPFSQWPSELTKDQQEIQKSARELVKKLLGAKWVSYRPLKHEKDDKTSFCDMELFGPGREILKKRWEGKLPSERVYWGGYHLNILLVERGYSPYVRSPKRILKWHDQFLAAEELAKKNKRGIWNSPKLLQHLQKKAAGKDKGDK